MIHLLKYIFQYIDWLMDLNKHALEGIQLAGDPIICSDDVFQRLCKGVFHIILNQQQSDAEEVLGKLPILYGEIVLGVLRFGKVISKMILSVVI